MLIEFRVENHRSIRDEQVLTLEVGRAGAAGGTGPRSVDGSRKDLLPAAGLYGANASGKSNLLRAFRFMRDAVVYSHRTWAPDEGTPRDPFAWGPKRDEPSSFEVTFVVSGIRYQYGFVIDDERFDEEWLFAWPNNRKQVWLERDGDAFRFGQHLRGSNKLIEEITRDNALFLSAAVQHGHEQLTRVYGWFRDVRTVNVAASPRLAGHWPYLFRVMADGATRTGVGAVLERGSDGAWMDSLKRLLRSADVGIVDLKVVEVQDNLAAHGTHQVLLRHSDEDEQAWLPLEEESAGTVTLFEIGPAVLDVLHEGGVLIVDELESSLHPLLARRVVEVFNDPETNPHHAQLLFTTHDTNLLGRTTGDPALRRDQVWLTEKDTDGATVLYPLTDYKPRKNENLERGYLQGRYGAIPFLGGFTAWKE